jgi:hypothetical protein
MYVSDVDTRHHSQCIETMMRHVTQITPSLRRLAVWSVLQIPRSSTGSLPIFFPRHSSKAILFTLVRRLTTTLGSGTDSLGPKGTISTELTRKWNESTSPFEAIRLFAPKEVTDDEIKEVLSNTPAITTLAELRKKKLPHRTPR